MAAHHQFEPIFLGHFALPLLFPCNYPAPIFPYPRSDFSIWQDEEIMPQVKRGCMEPDRVWDTRERRRRKVRFDDEVQVLPGVGGDEYEVMGEEDKAIESVETAETMAPVVPEEVAGVEIVAQQVAAPSDLEKLWVNLWTWL